MVKTAVQRALRDSKLDYKLIESAAVGYVYGDSTCGNRALYEVGMSGILLKYLLVFRNTYI